MTLFRQKHLIYSLTLVCALLLVSGCSWNGDGESSGEQVVLRVGDETVTKSEFDEQVEMQMQQMGAQIKQMPENRQQMLKQQIRQSLKKQMVQQLVLKDAAKSSESTVTDAEVQDFLEEELTEQQRKQAQKRMEEAGENLEDRAGEALLIRKYLQENVGEIEVSDQELKDYFEENKDQFSQPEQVKARHILIKTEERDEQEAKELATEVKSNLENGADFCAQAEEYSEGPSAEDCGKLGFFSRNRMAKPFAEAAFSMKANEVSDPVKTRFGYHVIEKLDHREAQSPDFEEVKAQVKEQLVQEKKQQKQQELIQELVEEAEIERNFPQKQSAQQQPTPGAGQTGRGGGQQPPTQQGR